VRILLELKWDGKDEALEVAKETETRLLEFDKNLSFGEKNSGNMIVQGDNLQVLKSLLPFYRGQVKCIYIDPPYNTGAAFENYNDNFPHSDWLSMMYPRLELLQEFLSDDGAIFISIDDNEQAYLKVICDEIFTRKNFVAQFCVKRSGGRQDSKFFAVTNEFLFCYANNINNFVAGEEIKASEKFPKFDETEGKFYKTQLLRKWGSNSRRTDRPNLFYEIPAPDGTKIFPMLPNGTEGRWRWGKNKMQDALDEGKIEFVKKNDGWIAYEKIFQPEDGTGTKKFTTWIDENFSGADDLKNVFGEKVFDYPKSVGLIEKILRMCNADEDAIILDCFAGSGTTAHAVLKLNESDGGTRKFILIEEKEYCKTITAERVRRVGGSFDFYRLGAEISDAEGKINSSVTFEQLANFVWFSATKTPYLEQKNSPLLGVYNGTAIYLLYNGILKDKSVKGGNILTKKILSALPKHDGEKIIYGSACRIDENFLEENKIIFRQIPKELNL